MAQYVTLLYFAWVREKIGKGSETLILPDEVTTVSGLVRWLQQKDDCYQIALQDGSKIRVAVDQEYVSPEYVLENPREIAFFPPVTGG